MPRKAQSAKPAYSGAKAKKTAKPKKDAPKTARKPAGAKKAKPRTQACSDGIEQPKAKMGRPTKYDPAYCEMVVEWGRQGKSREWIGATLMVLPETMTEWAKAHPDFSDAITLAKHLELKWWEDAGQDNMTATGFSASAWSRSMAARFPTKWREKTQVDHGISDGLAALLGDLDGNSASLV